MKQIEWDWYGMWVIDWLTYNRDDLPNEAWGAFDIWKEAYLKANPELSGESDLDLIENHYCGAMEPFFKSWVFAVWIFLHRPIEMIYSLIWTVKRKF